MKLEKTRDALNLLASHIVAAGPCDHAAGLCVCGDRSMLDAAADELAQAESLLREAAALKVFAVAGLSAFHGTFCVGARDLTSTNASECDDAKCRAWTAAVKGDLDVTLKELTTLKDGEYDEAKRDARNATLEEALMVGEAAWAKIHPTRTMERLAAQSIIDAISDLKRGG